MVMFMNMVMQGGMVTDDVLKLVVFPLCGFCHPPWVQHCNDVLFSQSGAADGSLSSFYYPGWTPLDFEHLLVVTIFLGL